MTMESLGVVVLAGGGIDSTVCLRHLKDEGAQIRVLHVDFGQPAAKYEWDAVQRISKDLALFASQITVRSMHNFEPGEITGRNAMFVFLALTHILPHERAICLGIHAGTLFADCSRAFFDSISILVAEQTESRIRLLAPLLEFTKPEIVSLAQAKNWPLMDTYSCQRGVRDGCGECLSCKDRKAIGC